MAPIQNTDARRIDASFPALDDWRDIQAPSIGDYALLAERPWSEIKAIEIFPGVRLDADLLEIPAGWMPAGTLRRPGSRCITPRKAGVPSDPHLAAVRDESVRRALHALWLPRIMGNGVRESKPATWKARAGTLLRMAAWQLDKCPSQDGTVFSQFTVQNLLTGLYPDVEATPRMKADFETVLNSLIDAGLRGVISDWPKRFQHDGASENPTALERARKGSPVRVRALTHTSKHYEHFSDQFTTEFIGRALWIQENIANQVIDFWHEDTKLRKKFVQEGTPSHFPNVGEARIKALLSYPWKDRFGNALHQLPFPLRQSDGCGETLTREWPPKTIKSFKRIIGTIQGCNLGVVDFCTAARSSELLAADDTPLGRAEGHYNSVTFKLVDDVSGKPRDWPIHPAAVRALEIQHRIAVTLRPPGQDHLWVATQAGRGSRLTSASATFARAVSQLALEHLLGSSNAHMHRWRHTVARLVALSVVGAPQVLLDLFGHRDLEMTLQYMLSDPAIADEAMQVARETTYAMVQDAIQETDFGETSGPAAQALSERLPAMRRSEDAFDSTSLRETAEILTFNGRYWSLVRPGVICTKGLGQAGPCTARRGVPDPGSCRTTCDHRLETAFARKQCEETLVVLISERAVAIAEGADMLVAHLDGQIVAELKRWPEVRENTLAAHSELACLWEESTK